MGAPVKLFLASTNVGKLEEFRILADSADCSFPIELATIEGFAAWPAFEEIFPTFAENATGKALHYSRLHDGLVFADDSGLVVPSLGGNPGVRSARYAGPNASDEDRNRKLLGELAGRDRAASFVCAICLAKNGRVLAVVSDRADGSVAEAPAGFAGFGYDPLFYFPALQKTFAQLNPEEKNRYSHRGNTFRRLVRSMASAQAD